MGAGRRSMEALQITHEAITGWQLTWTWIAPCDIGSDDRVECRRITIADDIIDGGVKIVNQSFIVRRRARYWRDNAGIAQEHADIQQSSTCGNRETERHHEESLPSFPGCLIPGALRHFAVVHSAIRSGHGRRLRQWGATNIV
jgi:hypothetical protein